MKLKNTSLLLLLTVGLMACSSVKVSTDHDKNTDFSSFKSYQWINAKTVTNKDAIQVSDIMDMRIRNTINKQLTVQGYQQSEGVADLQINYSVLTRDETDIQSYQTYGGYSSRWGWGAGYGYRGMSGHSNTVIKTYQQGTLVIDFVDPKTNKLVWRGLGSDRIPSERTTENMDKLVSEMVQSILKKFPPKQKQD